MAPTPHRLARALDLIAKDISGEVQVNTLLTFLFIAERGTCTQSDVEAYLKISTAGASRNVSYWTDRRFDRTEGMGFIERVQDDYDRRLRNLSLTAKGKVFYKKLMEVSA